MRLASAVLMAVVLGGPVAVAVSPCVAAATAAPSDEAALVAKLRSRLTPLGQDFVAKQAADFVAGNTAPEAIRATASADMAYNGPGQPMIATLGNRGSDIDALVAVTMYNSAVLSDGDRHDQALQVLAYLTKKLNSAQPALPLN